LVAWMPGSGHDALVSDLLLPSRIAWQHVWEFDVDLYAWGVMPMLGDWLYVIGYMLAEETGARLINLFAILLLGRQIYELVTWLGGNRLGGYAALLIYLSTPLTMTESSSLFIEAAWSCLVVGGAMAVLRTASRDQGQQTVDPRHLVIAGILLGGALAA